MWRKGLRPAIAWALVILVLCLMPGRAIPSWDWTNLISLDKPVHAFLFGVLVVLLVRGFRDQQPAVIAQARIVPVAFTLTVAYGALTEWMQQLDLLGRHGDLNDLIANTVGACLGLLYLRWRSGKERSAGIHNVA